MAMTNRHTIKWPLLFLAVFSSFYFFFDLFIYELGVEVLADSLRVFNYLLGTIVWLLFAIVLNRIINILIWDGLFEGKQGKAVPKLFRDMVGAVILLAAIGGIISVVFKKDLTILLAATGGLGVVIGLAINELIADVFSGMALNVEKPFLLGDYVQIGDTEGKVVELNWRATHILTMENTMVIIPNSKLSTEVITNLHKNGTHFRASFDIHLKHSVGTKQALRLLNAAVKSVRFEQKDAPVSVDELESEVVAVDIDENGIRYQIRYWLPHYLEWSTIRTRVIANITEELSRAGISTAQPQEILHTAQSNEALSESERCRRLIRDTRIFADLDDEEVQQLSQSMKLNVYEASDTIIERGEEGRSMFFILEGLADVFIWVESQSKEVRVGSMASGVAFGEMSLLTGDPRSATIRACSQSLVYELTDDTLLKLLQKRPQLAEVISVVIAEYQLKDVALRERLSINEQKEQAANFAKNLLGKIHSFFNLK
jgi:small-conductance mechanosensitive channel/CRP-like cAMP-binding protein